MVTLRGFQEDAIEVAKRAGCALAPALCAPAPGAQTPPIVPNGSGTSTSSSDPSTSTWVWAGAAVVAVGGLVAFVLLRRKRR